MSDHELAELCRRWLQRDPAPWTRDEVTTWMSDLAKSPARARLAGQPMRFGTAGLRAAMGAGVDRMNALTVLQATQGLLAHILEEDAQCSGTQEPAPPPVVIGFDGRHHSREFAHIAAAVLVSRHRPVLLMTRETPTPLIAFAVREWRARAGIMVTASHNPRADNGYKVFWSDGCQILAPRDAHIEAHIRLNQEPWRTDYSKLPSHPEFAHLIHDKTDETVERYLSAVAGALKFTTNSPPRAATPIVYSAFHGVGAPFVAAIFDRFGLPPYIPVPEQNDIDPNFPTLAYPNPEEGRGALSLAFATAERQGARVVMANDPDADRLAVAERVVNSGEETWRTFDGNEMAALLGHWLWKNRPQGRRASEFAMVASTVSSKRLAAMAGKEGFEFRESLTGFKWLSHAALDLQQREGKTVLLTYEEAIGFLCGTVVLDKDGVSAAAVFGELVQEMYASGETLSSTLTHLNDLYGWHLNYNGYLRSDDPSVLSQAFDKVRSNGYPSKFVSPRTGRTYKVDSFRDLTLGTDTAQESGLSLLPGDKQSQFLTFRVQSLIEDMATTPDVVVSLRGSGTEPKVKYYSEMQCHTSKFVQSGKAAEWLRDIVETVIDDCLEPLKNRLVRPA